MMDIVFTDNGSGWHDVRLVEYRDDCQMHTLKFIGKVRLNKSEVENIKIDNHMGNLGVSFEDFDEYNYKGNVFNKIKNIVINHINNFMEVTIDKIDWSHCDNYIYFDLSNCFYGTSEVLDTLEEELKEEYPFIFKNFDVDIDIKQGSRDDKIDYKITIKNLGWIF